MKALAATPQIRGVYFGPKGLENAANEAVDKLLGKKMHALADTSIALITLVAKISLVCCLQESLSGVMVYTQALF